MEVMQFLAEYGVEFVIFGLSVAAFVVSIVRGNSISKAVKDFEEVNNLKFKTTATAQKNALKNSQEFTEVIPAYVLNPATNELEPLVTPVNIQKKIDSYVDTCLERSLQRFLPEVVSESDNVVDDYDTAVNDLAVMAEVMDTAEAYREKFNLPAEMSLKDVYARVEDYSSQLKRKLDELNKGGNKNAQNTQGAQSSQGAQNSQN